MGDLFSNALRRGRRRLTARTVENLTVVGAFVAGLGLVTFGVWQADHAAGLIVGGLTLAAAAVMYELGGGGQEPAP